jgi:hypothetical protein
VEIATTGQWYGIVFGLQGITPNGNHAKIGVSKNPKYPYAIFGDMNQQGTLGGNDCQSSQNGRGGTFYVLQNKGLYSGLKNLITGRTAPVAKGN